MMFPHENAMKVKPSTTGREAAMTATRRVVDGEIWPGAGVGMSPPFCLHFQTESYALRIVSQIGCFWVPVSWLGFLTTILEGRSFLQAAEKLFDTILSAPG
jgi:hypothetical protein